MRLFGWVQNKLCGKPVNKKPTTVSAPTNQICGKQEHGREEFKDWPDGILLAIGTFGNTRSEIKQSDENDDDVQENPYSSSISEEEIAVDLSPEEVGKLQKELTKLLSRKPNKEKELLIADLPLNRFLNCPSSLEVDRRISNALNFSELELMNHEDNIEKTIMSVIIDKCNKHISRSAQNKNNKPIGKKSISFLLQKMFVCTSGFAPTPSFRDTLQQSRTEKILKMMLQKKMNATNYSRPASLLMAKKHLENNKEMPKRRNSNEDDGENRNKNDNDGCKWVKTDSEYIVLEI